MELLPIFDEKWMHLILNNKKIYFTEDQKQKVTNEGYDFSLKNDFIEVFKWEKYNELQKTKRERRVEEIREEIIKKKTLSQAFDSRIEEEKNIEDEILEEINVLKVELIELLKVNKTENE
jgi:DNA repair exonuclease SbcCD nuclease subunit